MPIVGGMDIHRKQITSTCRPGDRGGGMRPDRPGRPAALRAWLERFEGIPDAAFAFEACTGWRYVAAELARAGVQAHLAEPAGHRGGPRPQEAGHTDRAASRLMRDLLLQGRLPECWIPPEHVLECRALLETYHALRREHTAWVQRAHAVLFHQGATRLREGGTGTAEGRELLREIAAGQLSPAGQQQIGLYLRMLEVTEAELDALRGQLTGTARRLAGAKALREQLYGVGPVTALALTCWLGGEGRFSPRARLSGSPGWTSPCTPAPASAPPGTCPGRDPRSFAGAPMRRVRSTPTARRRSRLLRAGQGPHRRQAGCPVRGPQDHPPGMPPARRARRRRARHGVTGSGDHRCRDCAPNGRHQQMGHHPTCRASQTARSCRAGRSRAASKE